MKTIHEENLVKAKRFLNTYKHKQKMKLFKGAHVEAFTKEELLKIIDILYISYLV